MIKDTAIPKLNLEHITRRGAEIGNFTKGAKQARYTSLTESARTLFYRLQYNFDCRKHWIKSYAKLTMSLHLNLTDFVKFRERYWNINSQNSLFTTTL